MSELGHEAWVEDGWLGDGDCAGVGWGEAVA
jgi:hypothetical protein